MKTLYEIKQTLIRCKPSIQEHYHVTELGIFGSYVRGEQHDKSDVDVLIDYEEAPSLLELASLENYLSTTLDMPVDVVTKRGMKPQIKERVLSEVIYV